MAKIERTIPEIKCPKCGSKICIIRELWSGYGQTYDLDEKGNVIDSGIDGSMDFDGIFEAECSNENCNHCWNLRNTISIKEVIHWEENHSIKNNYKYMKEENKLHK